MGAFGHEPFDNDDAADWLAALEESAELTAIEGALDAVFASETAAPGAAEEYLETAVCSRALAAAEVVAALLGKPASSLPQGARNWAQGKAAPPAELVDQAREAVRAIVDSSELQQLWEESEEYASWRAVNEDLLARLG